MKKLWKYLMSGSICTQMKMERWLARPVLSLLRDVLVSLPLHKMIVSLASLLYMIEIKMVLLKERSSLNFTKQHAGLSLPRSEKIWPNIILELIWRSSLKSKIKRTLLLMTCLDLRFLKTMNTLTFWCNSLTKEVMSLRKLGPWFRCLPQALKFIKQFSN